MNTSEQCAIVFIKDLIRGGTINMLDLESRRWCDATIHEEPIELEPHFVPFDPGLLFGRVSSEIKTAVPLGHVGERIFIELVPPLAEKCPFEQCENILRSQSVFSNYMSYEVIGNSKKITMYVTIDDSHVLSGFKASWHSVFPELKTKQLDSDPLADVNDDYDILDFYEIYCQPPYFMKMTTYMESVTNPIVKFMSLISGLSENEKGFLQVIYKPVKNNWYSNIRSILSIDPRISGRLAFPKSMSIKQLKTYGNKPFFAVKVRVGCVSKTDMLSNLKTYIAQFNYGGLPFLFLTKKDFGILSVEKIKSMIANRTSYVSGLILCSDELNCFVTMPDASIRNYGCINIKAIDNYKIQFRVPDELTGEGRPLGINDYGGTEKIVVLPDSEKNKSLLMPGASTFGKSCSMIHQMLYLKGKHAVIFIDPHDSADELLGYLKEEDVERTVYLNPAIKGFVPKFNIFAMKDEDEADMGRFAGDITLGFEKTFESTGPRMMHILRNLTNLVLLLKEGNLISILILLSRGQEAKSLINKALGKTQNPELIRFFREEYFSFPPDALTPISNKFSQLFLDQKIALFFSQTENLIDIAKVTQEKKILVVSLPIGILGESNVALIGSFIISQIYRTALAQVSLRRENRNQIFAFIDECSRFPAFKVISTIIHEMRKYGLHLCLSLHESSEVPDSALKALTSIPSILCFQVNAEDGKKIASAFGGAITSSDITKLGVGEVYAKISNKITSFKTFPPRTDFNEEIKQKIIDYNIREYYTPINEIQRKQKPQKREYEVF